MIQIKCEHCNKIFDSVRANRKFCSTQCKKDFFRGKPKSKKIRIKELRKCLYCDSEFIAIREEQKFCKQECMINYHKNALQNRTCLTCNKEFNPKRKNQQFCSIKCSKPRKNQYFTNTCKICNEQFESRYSDTELCNKCRVSLKTDKCAKWHGKWCQYRNIKVMSTYELRVCNILDKLVELGKIYKWDYTKDKIQYIGIDNKTHNYLIDFKVYNDEDNFYYLEVKGVKRKNDELKWDTVTKNGFNLEIWFLYNIEKLEYDLNISNDDIKYLLSTCILKKGGKL
jgi:hypothetical protein